MIGEVRCSGCGELIYETIPGSGVWIHQTTGQVQCPVDHEHPHRLPSAARPAASGPREAVA